MIWPYHPQPRADELFSSWLRRTAFGYEPRLHTFCNGLWPGLQIWNRDIDRDCPEILLEGLASGTGTSPTRARETLLGRYEGVVYEAAEGSAPGWILRLGVWHRKRRGFGQQFCPLCLAEDAAPYYRTRWRLAWVTTCPVHGCRLHDACEACDSPCAPHRCEEPLCDACGRDRRRQAALPADVAVLALERHLECAISCGYFVPFGPDGVHPLVVFGTLRRLVKVITSGPRSARLRTIVADHRPEIRHLVDRAASGCDEGVEFEQLRCLTRHMAMAVIARCLAGWPFMMVGYFGEAGVWRSWALRDRLPAQVPFELARTIDPYLRPG